MKILSDALAVERGVTPAGLETLRFVRLEPQEGPGHYLSLLRGSFLCERPLSPKMKTLALERHSVCGEGVLPGPLQRFGFLLPLLGDSFMSELVLWAKIRPV